MLKSHLGCELVLSAVGRLVGAVGVCWYFRVQLIHITHDADRPVILQIPRVPFHVY